MAHFIRRLPKSLLYRAFHDCPSHNVQPVRLLLIGCPGSGKGTQSSRLQKNFGVSHLSSGDMLRKNINDQTFIGKQARQYVENGKLVPDELLVSLINNELNCVDSTHWLLDGFPRTVNQAMALDAKLGSLMQPLNLVINLQVPEDIILQRIMDRWIHAPSGRVYNLSYNPPRTPGRDDITGEPLTQRSDDTPEVFKIRLDQHHRMTEPLLEHYRHQLVNVKGNTSDEIYPQIEREIVNRLGVLPGTLSDSHSITTLKPRIQPAYNDNQQLNAEASF